MFSRFLKSQQIAIKPTVTGRSGFGCVVQRNTSHRHSGW